MQHPPNWPFGVRYPPYCQRELYEVGIWSSYIPGSNHHSSESRRPQALLSGRTEIPGPGWGDNQMAHLPGNLKGTSESWARHWSEHWEKAGSGQPYLACLQRNRKNCFAERGAVGRGDEITWPQRARHSVVGGSVVHFGGDMFCSWFQVFLGPVLNSLPLGLCWYFSSSPKNSTPLLTF